MGKGVVGLLAGYETFSKILKKTFAIFQEQNRAMHVHLIAITIALVVPDTVAWVGFKTSEHVKRTCNKFPIILFEKLQVVLCYLSTSTVEVYQITK